MYDFEGQNARVLGIDPKITLGSVINIGVTLLGVVMPLLFMAHNMIVQQALDDQSIARNAERISKVEVFQSQQKDLAAAQFRALSIQLTELQTEIGELKDMRKVR